MRDDELGRLKVAIHELYHANSLSEAQPTEIAISKNGKEQVFLHHEHQIGGREGAEVGEFMQTICASPWNTGFTLTPRHLSYYERRAGC